MGLGSIQQQAGAACIGNGTSRSSSVYNCATSKGRYTRTAHFRFNQIILRSAGGV
jgi:hypothetical protein